MANKKIILIVVALLLVAVGVWWYIQMPARVPSVSTPGQSTTSTANSTGLGGQIFEQATPNPAQAMPDTNPFATDTNPFANGYKNPFGN